MTTHVVSTDLHRQPALARGTQFRRPRRRRPLGAPPIAPGQGWPPAFTGALAPFHGLLEAGELLQARLDGLHSRALAARVGCLERLRELHPFLPWLPHRVKHEMGERLAARSAHLGISLRLRRLGKALDAFAARARGLLLRAAEEHERSGSVPRELAAAAGRLQRHRVALWQIIERTNQRLAATVDDLFARVVG